MRNARTVMDAYRKYLVTFKEHANCESEKSRPIRRAPGRTQRQWRKAAARALLHYRGMIDSYLKAKRAVVAGEERVDA
jgi:hypothetical protein